MTAAHCAGAGGSAAAVRQLEPGCDACAIARPQVRDNLLCLAACHMECMTLLLLVHRKEPLNSVLLDLHLA